MKKRIIGILLTAFMLIGILPLGAVPVFADGGCIHSDTDGNGYCDNCGAVKYYAWNEVSEALEENYYEGTPMVITSETSSLSEGWYIASGEISRGNINVSGNVNIILFDDCDLTVNGSIILATDANLSIYSSEAKCKGKITANGTIASGLYGDGNNTLSIHGGRLFACGGWEGIYASAGISVKTLNVYNGEVSAIGGETAIIDLEYGPEPYGLGASGFAGNVNIADGAFYAKGGDGHTVMFAPNFWFMDEGGAGVSGNVTISGGYANISSGRSTGEHTNVVGLDGTLTFNGGAVSILGGDGKAALENFVLGEGVTLYNGTDDSVIETEGTYNDVIQSLTDYSSGRGAITVYSIDREKPTVSYLAYNTSTNEYETKTISDYKTYIPSANAWKSGWYVIDHSMMIKGFNAGINANVILCDDCFLDVDGQFGPSNLNIYTTSLGEDMGSLSVQGEKNKDGIYSSVTVHGGNVKAIGGERKSGFHGNLTVYGGNVEAYGGKPDSYGYGGMGIDALLSRVNVYGGKLFAAGTSNFAGITGKVSIYGGAVDARGGDHAAGIGASTQTSDNTFVVIEGGDVKACGGKGGAGIGGSETSGVGSITITGGTVYAEGNYGGAGIGGGVKGDGGKIRISGGKIIAKGSEMSAGIGGGNGASGGVIEIYGGDIEAYGAGDESLGGAGIGAGAYLSVDCFCYGDDIEIYESGTAGKITINDGNIKAFGGGYNAAGIGGGYGCNSGEIKIHGGVINTVGGENAGGIGAGYYDFIDFLYSDTLIAPVPGGSTTVDGGFIDGTAADKTLTLPDNEPTIWDDGSYHIGYTFIPGAEELTCLKPGYKSCYKNNYTGEYHSSFPFDENNLIGGEDALIAWKSEGGEGYLGYGEHAWKYTDSSVHTCTVCHITEKHDAPDEYGKCGKCDKLMYYYEYNAWLGRYEAKAIPDGAVEIDDMSDLYVGEFSAKNYDFHQDWYIITDDVDLTVRCEAYDLDDPDKEIHIILANGVTLNAAKGIRVCNPLTIYAMSTDETKMGKIVAKNVEKGCAAIGGGLVEMGALNSTANGAITIHGGQFDVKGGEGAAGIGGGLLGMDTDYRSCGDITIYGGNFKVTGGDRGAAIGSGFKAEKCEMDITIYGGTFVLDGGAGAAGIGSGGSANKNDSFKEKVDGANIYYEPASAVGDITIEGGTFEIRGRSGGAGIGSGARGGCENITFNGGTLCNVIGNYSNDDPYGAAGIGSGYMAYCGNITFYDGIFYDISSASHGAAIGSGAGYSTVGAGRSCGKIVFNGGIFTKIIGGYYSPGIGVGCVVAENNKFYAPWCEKIEFNGGYIQAIGGGYWHNTLRTTVYPPVGAGGGAEDVNEPEVSYAEGMFSQMIVFAIPNYPKLDREVINIGYKKDATCTEDGQLPVFGIVDAHLENRGRETPVIDGEKYFTSISGLESAIYVDPYGNQIYDPWILKGDAIGDEEALDTWLKTTESEGGGIIPAAGHKFDIVLIHEHQCSVCNLKEAHCDNDENEYCDVCNRSLAHIWTTDYYNHKCEDCLLEGRHIDSDKNDICDICGAKGVSYYCPTCGGRGKLGGIVECPKCSGSGTVAVVCPECCGTCTVTCFMCEGEIPECWRCDGCGLEKCPDCDKMPPCDYCKGNRYLLCPYCFGAECEHCDEGMIDCPACGTTGHQICTTCNGEEYFDCSYCGGSGYAVCSICGNKGTVTCPECNGEGTVEDTCLNCYGCGTINLGEEVICPDCHGTDYHSHFWEPTDDRTHACPCGASETHCDENMDRICDACDSSISSELCVVSLGAKINESTSSLRLGAAYNGYLLFDWERENVEDLGIIFYPTHLLGSEHLELENEKVAHVKANGIVEFDPDKAFKDYERFTFYVTIVNIPKGGYDTKISFRPYIILGSDVIVYGDVMERCYNDVLNAQ